MPVPSGPKEEQERKRKALLLLGQGAKVADVAAACNVSVVAVYNWMKRPDFRNEMRRYNDRVTFAGLTRLQQNFNAAVDVLIQDLKADDQNLRHKAAVDYTKIVMDGRRFDDENAELRDHIAKIYAAVQKLDPDQRKTVMNAYQTEEETIDTLAIEEEVPRDENYNFWDFPNAKQERRGVPSDNYEHEEEAEEDEGGL